MRLDRRTTLGTIAKAEETYRPCRAMARLVRAIAIPALGR